MSLTLLNQNAANDIILKYLKQNMPEIQGNMAKSTISGCFLIHTLEIDKIVSNN